jgi:hypothetical protein
MSRRKDYAITPKGRAVLHGPTAWALSRHLRDVLAFCDPQVPLETLQQWMPRESLRVALYALQELELVIGPPVDAPTDHRLWTLKGRPDVARVSL